MTDVLVRAAIPTALSLVDAVHDGGPDAVRDVLTPLDQQGTWALAVTLAALVPDDKPVSELLAWMDRTLAEKAKAARAAEGKPCGTFAAYWRHKRHDEQPCDPCREAYAAHYREMRQPRQLTPHGTPGALRRHELAHETPCDACRAFRNERAKKYRQAS